MNRELFTFSADLIKQMQDRIIASMENEFHNRFAERCQIEPYSVISELLATVSRQAGEINQLTNLKDASLSASEARFIIRLIRDRSTSVGRDFTQEEAEENLIKKLWGILEAGK